jgi:arylsulfatase A-like enzyme
MQRYLVSLLAVSLAAGPVVAAPPAETPARPNILFIVADDLGYADVGFQGCKDVPTPHADALAKAGTRFSSGYVSGPYCSPTRAALMTGRYQQRYGHEFNPTGNGPEIGLPTTETTLADRLKAAGYVTGLVGKWHLGAAEKFHPQKRGFGEFFGFLGGAHPYFPGMGAAILRGDQTTVEKEYLTDAFGREAVAFIDRNKDRPFFLYLAFNAVHTPMHATDERLKQFAGVEPMQRRTYAAMLAALDENIGRVLDKVRAEKLEEKTLIAFISDNGGPTMPGTTINASRNTPLRGSKRTTLEGGIRVPFVLAWKGQVPAGVIYEQPVIQMDLTATALTVAGIEPKPEWKLDGVDLLPYLKGTATGKPHDALYWRLGTQMAVRQGDWKLVKYDLAAEGGKAGEASPFRLYNLTNDIGEATDLAAKLPDKVQQLEGLWNKWAADLAKPRWGGGMGRQ